MARGTVHFYAVRSENRNGSYCGLIFGLTSYHPVFYVHQDRGVVCVHHHLLVGALLPEILEGNEYHLQHL